MFRRRNRSPENLQLTETAELLRKLDPGLDSRLMWISATVGRCALDREADHKTAGPHYTLTVGKYRTAENRWPLDRYSLLGTGDLLAVTHCLLDADDPYSSEQAETLNFQIDNGLFVPNEDDKREALRILRHGVMDTVINT